MSTPITPSDVVAFWKDAGPSKWFAKDDAFDAEFRRRFDFAAGNFQDLAHCIDDYAHLLAAVGRFDFDDDDTGAALSGVIKCLLNDLFGQRRNVCICSWTTSSWKQCT